MKKTILILAMLLTFLVNIYAENPYKQFGSEGVELLTEQERSGEYIFEIKSTQSDSTSNFLYFNVKEGTATVLSINNDTINIVKIDPTIVKTWLSIDPLAQKYPSVSPYVAMGNNPILMVDPDGRDEVYFNWQGDEVNRKPSDEIFKTYVGDDKYWHEAVMPKIIQGYEDPIYQKFDYSIAAQTFIFNNCPPEARPSKGMPLEGGEPAPLDPTLLKSMIIEESKASLYKGKQNGDKDIMQVNVLDDWDKVKKSMGLVKGVVPNPQQSIYSGIRWLYYKGLQANSETNKKGEFVRLTNITWRGGDKTSWWNAVQLYNASRNSESYLKRVQAYYFNSSDPIPSNYISPKK